MPSPANYHSLQYPDDNPGEEQSEDRDRALWLVAEREFGNGQNGGSIHRIDCRTPTSVPPSPVSPLSEHGSAMFRPASSEDESRPSSVDIVEKKLQNSAPRRSGWWSRLVSDSWIIELVASFVSFAAIASIIGVLWGYDQKPVPPLMKGITLNAVISFLATISRTAIMLCVGTVISQGKWLWFKKERSLMDLQNIEDASRGPLGSILMLFRFKGGALPYLAAFLTVAALGFDSFVQQLLTTENRTVPVPGNGISINSSTSMTTDIYLAMGYPETLAQLTAAMLANVQQEDQPMDIMAASTVGRHAMKKRSEATTQTLALPLKADCPSGNCVWQPYYTLDICTQCRPTTKELTIKNLSPQSSDLTKIVSAARSGNISGADQQTSSFTWEIIPKFGQTWKVTSNLSAFVDENDMNGNAQGLEVYVSITQKVVWPLNFASSDGLLLDPRGWTKQPFAGINEPVAAIGFAEFDVDDNGVPALNNSLECAMTYCVREYSTSVVQGNLVLDVLSTHYGKVDGDPDAASGLSWSAEVNGTSFTADDFLTYGTGIGTLTGYVLGNSTHSYKGSCLASSNWSCSAPVTSNSGSVEGLSTEAWKGVDLTPNFAAVVEDANTVMSQIVQQYGNVSVIGDNAVLKTFVVVRWAWITLPAAIVLFGVGCLGLTVWETSRMQAPSWKASLLPLLYRYVDVDESSAEGRSNTAAAAGPVTGQPSREPDDGFTCSNLVSEFQAEAEATATRFTRRAPKLQIWQLQSLEIIQKDPKTWWQRLKWG
ncbi:uncharacterized protein PV07_00793 [Cladophialophora immunda]|uniref:Uncharacterized protein n=1 Tax=Cladophialophora immunda TaxID=569365 RepID=A0A0D2B8N0_9EURO|nr:uncharacterized protein PV07_00793 [Cladophialophora immunda]KIW33987.1 hypothetical protein PV07_00793 [Cladophialophora immunda]